MAFLMSAIDVAAPSGPWQWFILNVFSFIADYGWRIVVFVILLKLVLSPLDFYQRYKMRKNQRITEALKPQMDRLEKQYGEDKQALQRKQMELNRKAGFSYMSACIPLIVTLVLFITFYSALRSVSAYMEFKQYVEMYDGYVTAYNETGFDYNSYLREKFVISADGVDFREMDKWLENVFENEESLEIYLSEDLNKIFKDELEGYDLSSTLMQYKTDYIEEGMSYKDFIDSNKGEFAASDTSSFIKAMSVLMRAKAQENVVTIYEENHTSFLWVKSLWVADVPWSNSVPEYSTFKNTVNPSASGKKYMTWDQNPGEVYKDNQTMFNDMSKEQTYNIVTAGIRKRDDLYKTNGYLIMVVLVVGLSLLSQFISMRQQKKSGQAPQGQGAGMMKAMLWMMPIMLAAFAITSSSAFTLYMIINSMMTLIINFITSMIVNLIFGKSENRSNVIKHGRVDPNDRTKTNRR